MYKSIRIKNFRCFEDISLEKLRRINLIVGKNNAGKTALLEALFLLCGSYNPELTFKLNAFRGIESLKIEFGSWTGTPWDSLFKNFNYENDIEITGEDSKRGKRILKIHILNKPQDFLKLKRLELSFFESSPKTIIKEKQELPYSGYSGDLSHLNMAKVIEFNFKSQNDKRERESASYYLILDPTGKKLIPFPPPPPFPTFYQSPKIKSPYEASEQFSQLKMRGKEKILLEKLQIIEPRLKELSVLVEGGISIIYGDIGLNRLVPLPLMGEGMVTIAKMVLNIASAPDGVVLIDEIENGIHHSVLRTIWKEINEVSKDFNVQIFATTHSMECVMAAHEAFANSPEYDFRLYRLERVNDLIKAISYDKETLATAIASELEVR